jgi:penicillin-binding protein 2
MRADERNKEYPGFNERLRFIAIVVVVSFLLLMVRLWNLQVMRWTEFSKKSDSNRLHIQRLVAPRGMIYGVRGNADQVVLADNRAAHDLKFVLADCDIDPAIVCKRLEGLLGIDAEELLGKINAAKKSKRPYTQIEIERDVPHGVLARVEEYSYALPGVFTVIRPQRRYLYGNTAGQLMGYIGVDPKAYRPDSGYSISDRFGKAGLELAYEDLLHGQDGKMLVTQYARSTPQLRTDVQGRPQIEVDDHGHSLVREEEKSAIPGRPLQLTLDIGVQVRAEELLEGIEGAIVVLDADSGSVLAMASSSRYDPTVFVVEGRDEQRVEALKGKPHRAYREVYAPGSVFKIAMAIAALEEGVLDEDTTFSCYGSFRLTPNGRPSHCWRRNGHGKVNVVDALAFSCDVFFYNVGIQLDVDRIHAWAGKLGMGKKTGIDLSGEEAGINPSRPWLKEKLRRELPGEPWNQNWFPGHTVNLSIGQGFATMTPLQCALLIAQVTNGGNTVRPHLNRLLKTPPPSLDLHPTTLEIVRKGLLKCVEKGPPAPTGTGNAARIEGMKIIGKTGTAQVSTLESRDKFTDNGEEIPNVLLHHAWFVAGVLDREPRIAVCVLVEHGESASEVAAPLAREIIEYVYASRAPVVDETRPDVEVAQAGERSP